MITRITMHCRPIYLLLCFLLIASGSFARAQELTLRHDEESGKITVHRKGIEQPLITQNAREDFRPYLHPLLAPGQSEASREEPRNPAALLLGEGHMEQRARQQPTKKSLSWFAWAIR